jgi:CHAT domain-containing protein
MPQIAGDGLAPPPPGALLVAIAPLGRGAAILAADGRTVTARRAPELDARASADALASAILEPLRGAIVAASRLLIVASGAYARVDVHALPFDGAPLVARAPVEYPLDIAALAPSSRAPDAVAIVGDPRSDLPSAREEASAVATLVGDAAVVERLDGERATRDAVARAIAAAGLFHYAGHGAFRGQDGYESALPLARASELDVPDILALAHVPSDVLLSGCDTARASAGDEPQALGVAQAFLVAGASRVVAASRAVDDASAADLMVSLYRARAARPDGDLAAWLRDAQLEARAAGRGDAWAAFRALRR